MCDNVANDTFASSWPENETCDSRTWRHCEFNFHFMNALRGTAVWPYGSAPTVYADTSGDGIVSWYEALRYEQRCNSQDEIPVYFDPTMTTWMVRASIPPGVEHPKQVRHGAGIAVPRADSIQGTTAYALKGNRTTQFWGYSIARDSWFTLENIPDSSGKLFVWTGGTLTAGFDRMLYATKGKKCLEFWRYDPQGTGNRWTQLENVPGSKALGPGSSATAVQRGDTTSDTTFIYLLKAHGTYEFYRYNAQTGHWDAPGSLTAAPPGPNNRKFKKGSCIAYDGGDTIYVLKGKYNEFYAYSVSGNSWSSGPALPFYGQSATKVKAGDGAAMAFYGDRLYVMKGGNSDEVWVYDRSPAVSAWVQAESLPRAPSGKPVKAGGCMAAAHNFLWVLKGNRQPDYYRFTPTQMLTPPPLQPQPPPPGANEFCLAPDGDAEDVRWSSSGEWAAYTAPVGNGNRQVFKVSSSGGESTQLCWMPADCGRPVWSPDDSLIAFEATPDTSPYSQIAIVPANGGQVMFVTLSPWNHWHATWSPDGIVAFLRDDSTGFAQVYENLTTGETPLTQQPVEHESPEFVTSTLLTFVREDANGHTQVFKTPVGSLNELQLTSLPYDHANPVPAPLAGMVYYEMVDAYGFSQIGGVPVDGMSSEVILTSELADFESPTVNSAGTAIFCSRSTGPGNSIYEVFPTGGGEQLTDDLVERVNPHAQPNEPASASVAYARDGDVFKIQTTNGRGQQSSGQYALALSGAEPNPATGRVTIRWQVPVETDVSLMVYNAAGQLVKVLADGRTKPGAYTSTWNGTDAHGRSLANGIYFVKLNNGEKGVSRKVVLTD